MLLLEIFWLFKLLLVFLVIIIGLLFILLVLVLVLLVLILILFILSLVLFILLLVLFILLLVVIVKLCCWNNLSSSFFAVISPFLNCCLEVFGGVISVTLKIKLVLVDY